MKPLVGITSAYENRKRRDYECLSYNYIKAVELAGGIPISIPALTENENIEEYLEHIDALVLSGGEDIEPSLYNESPIQELGEVCPSRDHLEVKLFLKALEKNIPVLGICRGIQLINVALGGSLYQDINVQQGSDFNHLAEEDPVETLQHEISIDKTSKLYKILGTEKLEVNSLHHQAIKSLGENLKVTAVAFDGVIEAIEYEGNRFVMGVQWHPEDLAVKSGDFLNLFTQLISEIEHI